MAVPAVTVDIVEKVDAFLTGWGPTRNPEGPKFPNQELLFTVFSTRLSETDRSIGCLTDGGSRT
jgi:hypothetical protein